MSTKVKTYKGSGATRRGIARMARRGWTVTSQSVVRTVFWRPNKYTVTFTK